MNTPARSVGQLHRHAVVEAQLAQLCAQARDRQRAQSGGIHRRRLHRDRELDRLAVAQRGEFRRSPDREVVHLLVEVLGGNIVARLERRSSIATSRSPTLRARFAQGLPG
jgi:hypothetical protein